MSGIEDQVFDIVNEMIQRVVEEEEEEDVVRQVVADLVGDVVDQEELEEWLESLRREPTEEEVEWNGDAEGVTGLVEENEQEWPGQVGGASLRVHGRRVDEVEGRFRGAATFVTLQIEIPRNMAADPNGPELFGDAVVRLVLQNAPPSTSQSSTKVGVMFESDELLESVGLCFKNISNINAQDVVESMHDMAQSNKSPLELQVPRLSMRITYVTPPSGSGKRRFTHEKMLNLITTEKRRRAAEAGDVGNDDDGADLVDTEDAGVDEEEEEEEEEESGNVMRNNVSQNCLPHALYQAACYSRYKKNPTGANLVMYRNSLRKTDNKNRYKKVHEAVEKMKLEAGVNKCMDFDVVEIAQFQTTVFKDYQIVVFSDRQYTPYYEGDFQGDGQQLYLLLENQHYRGVRTLPDLLSCKYYCALCQTGYRDVRTHYKCPKIHQSCGKPHDECPQTMRDVKTECPVCHVLFRSVVCYENHKKKGPNNGKSRCDDTYTCKKCKKPVFLNKNRRPHVCGESYCHRCQQPRSNDHHCTMLGCPKKESQITRKRLFFDIESRADDEGRQYPVLFVSLKCCPDCSHDIPKIMRDAEDLSCDKCSPDGRLKVIECVSAGNQHVDVAKKMTEYIFSLKHKGFVAVAHNASGYDGQFILENLIASNKSAPELCLNGTKLIYLKHKGVKMVDSLKYLTMSLSSVGKTFQIDSVKGDFPVQFIKPENYDYIGPLPDSEYYGLDNKSPTDRKKLEEFLGEQRTAGTIFNFSEELHRYCYNDVYILAAAMTCFEASFETMTNVCLLEESTTAASAAIKVFRRNHLKEDAIVLDAKPAAAGNASVMSQKFLAWIGHSENIQVDISTTYGEKMVAGHRVDGFIQPCAQYPSGKILEFYGCYFHGHSCKYSDDARIGEHSAKEIRARDERREIALRRCHPMEVFYECQVEEMLKKDKEMAAFFDDYEAKDLLHCERALAGGRTEVFRLYADNIGKKLHYLDVVSLYPTVMRYERFPVGPPAAVPRSTIPTPIKTPDGICSNGEEFDGFISCRVAPPRGLKIPLLPGRAENRLMFTLCMKCAKKASPTTCPHSDQERSFNGTFTTPELKKALTLGYVITEIYHAVKYDTWLENDTEGDGGLFTGYIKQMMIEKIYSTGYPADIVTDDQKERFRKEIEENEKIVLDEPERFVHNAGKRAVAKLMLNSLWGKLAQKVDRDEVKIVIKPVEFWKMMYDTTIVVVDVRAVNNCMVIKYRRQAETLQSLRTGAVHIAALVTSYARLRLYDLMEKVGGDGVIYCDTDSVVFSVPDGQENPLAGQMGPFFGQLTNEVAGELTKFVSIGPKTYCFEDKLENGQIKVVRKAKGVTINSNVDKQYTIGLLEAMVKEVMDGKTDRTVMQFDQFTMKRDQHHRVYAQSFKKAFKYTFMKRQVLSDGSTLPYGY